MKRVLEIVGEIAGSLGEAGIDIKKTDPFHARHEFPDWDWDEKDIKSQIQKAESKAKRKVPDVLYDIVGSLDGVRLSGERGPKWKMLKKPKIVSIDKWQVSPSAAINRGEKDRVSASATVKLEAPAEIERWFRDWRDANIWFGGEMTDWNIKRGDREGFHLFSQMIGVQRNPDKITMSVAVIVPLKMKAVAR